MRENRKAFRKCLLTGATSGIGLELAHLIAKKKIPLILVGRDNKALKTLGKALSSFVDIEYIEANLKEAKERAKVIEIIREEVPDLVINNAGLGFYSLGLESSTKEEVEVLTVNGIALLELTLEAGKALKEAKKPGTIVNVSSIAGEFPCPGMATYGASKAFVTSFSKALDFELRGTGIRILTTAPGKVATSFSKKAAKKSLLSSSSSMSSKQAASLIWKQIERQKGYLVFGFRTRLRGWIASLLPEFFPKKMIYESIKKRIK